MNKTKLVNKIVYYGLISLVAILAITVLIQLVWILILLKSAKKIKAEPLKKKENKPDLAVENLKSDIDINNLPPLSQIRPLKDESETNKYEMVGNPC